MTSSNTPSNTPSNAPSRIPFHSPAIKLSTRRPYADSALGRWALIALAVGTATWLSGCASTMGSIHFRSNAVSELAQTEAFEKDKTYKITILHTNDHHGRFWKNRDGEYGMAARKTLIDEIRAEVKAAGGHSLLLDGGDVNTGVPESDTQDAEPDFRGMAALGYDAMAVGNHEFDKPLATLKKQIAWAGFPVLSANIYDKNSGERVFSPYTLFNLGGVKVAVMGMTTADTYKLVSPENVKNIEFRPTSEEAKRLVPELRQKADVVIAATHMGHYDDGDSGSAAPGDVEMARAVKGIDLIIGGHSQNPVCMKAENVKLSTKEYVPGTECKPDRQNGTWIVQAHEWGKYVGRADFEFKNGALTLVKYALLPVNLKKTVKGEDGKDKKVVYTKEIAEDAQVLALLKPFQDKGDKLLSVQVGALVGDLDGSRENVRSKPTNLGVLIATAMMERTKADFAIMNSGGVRDSIKAGAVSYRDILKVQPFSNTIVSVDLKGSEVVNLLSVAAKMSKGSGAFPQFAGLELVIEGEKEQAKVVRAKIKGADIDPANTYRVALNNFVASGGDGYPVLNKHKGYVDTGFVDAEVLKALFLRGQVKAADFEPGTAVLRK